jgi:glycosyltransferase involved in cell wall biosynthesis
MTANLAVIILTFNEEMNIEQALGSVCGWANEIFILDSLSTDRTLEIAGGYRCHIAEYKFENYAEQRNYALDHLPIRSEWVLFLDADEWLPDVLKREISALVADSPEENGFYINRRMIWMGRWIRRGYYPSWILRLFRHGKGRYGERAVNEHVLVKGKTGNLRNAFMHEDRKGVSDWIAKHNGYATWEARELLIMHSAAGNQEIDPSLFGTQAQRKRWLRQKVWNRLPPLIRPFFYFFYRYVLAGGFLDGKEAFIYHILQALWFPLLIDVKYLELRQRTLGKSPATDALGTSHAMRTRLEK